MIIIWSGFRARVDCPARDVAWREGPPCAIFNLQCVCFASVSLSCTCFASVSHSSVLFCFYLRYLLLDLSSYFACFKSVMCLLCHRSLLFLVLFVMCLSFYFLFFIYVFFCLCPSTLGFTCHVFVLRPCPLLFCFLFVMCLFCVFLLLFVLLSCVLFYVLFLICHVFAFVPFHSSAFCLRCVCFAFVWANHLQCLGN